MGNGGGNKLSKRFKRLRFGNKYVEFAFNENTGELLELINKRTGENLIKNHWQNRFMPFQIEISHINKNSDTIILGPGPDSEPEFIIQEISNDQKELKVLFDCLSGRDILMQNMSNNKRLYKIAVTYSVKIFSNSPETFWYIEIFNNEDNVRINNVMFPCIFGIYIGESWMDDELVYPYIAGEKIINPVENFAKPPKLIRWKWQDYEYVYGMDGVFTRQEDGAYVREFNYCGAASMMWMDYFEKTQGVYIASYDSSFPITGIHAETFGPNNPGMGFFIRKYPEILPNKRWTSQPYAVAIHEGDWHWGADRYREWLETYIKKAQRPQWIEKSPGLIAHYDFKYQSGCIVHTFNDIPELFDKSKNIGIDHLLLAGWHTGGFDNGFPLYRPDMDLGSEDDIKNKINDVKQKGGHISFYINSRLCNRRLKSYEKFMNESGIVMSDGSLASENYGNQEFVVMCPNDNGWQTYLKNVVNWLVEKLSVDGIYFDQMSMAPPYLCYSSSHGHDTPAQWNKGYISLLKHINYIYDEKFKKQGSEKPALFIEGCGDVYGYLVSGQLISTFFYWHCGAYPELYKYTFPEHILIDMIYPSKGQVMRPVHVSQVARELLNKAFIIDSYFWIYDLEEDNTFYKDPEMLAYLKKVIAFKKFWLERFGHGIFKDDIGLYCEDKAIIAKLYYLLNDTKNNSFLIAIWNKKPRDDQKIYVKWDSNIKPEVVCYELDTDFLGEKLNVEIRYETLGGINNGKGRGEKVNRYLEIPVSTKELSLIYIEG